MKIITTLITALLLSLISKADINLYTDRPTARLQPIVDEFTALTGEKVNIVELAYPQLKAKLEAEGEQSPADLIFVKDLVYLNELSQLRWLKPIINPNLKSVVPQGLIHSSQDWIAVSFRARTIVYNPNSVEAHSLQDYSDLAKPEWNGRVCLRSGSHPYNTALISSFIHNYGYEMTKNFLSKIINNLAVAPLNGDTAVINAIANGQCDIGIVNHYYLAPLVEANPAFPVKVQFVNQKTTGTHINGTGIGIYRKSKNTVQAEKFIEFLLTDKIQQQFSAAHYDYPAKVNLIPTSLISNWGQFKADSVSWEALDQHLNATKTLINEINYK